MIYLKKMRSSFKAFSCVMLLTFTSHSAQEIRIQAFKNDATGQGHIPEYIGLKDDRIPFSRFYASTYSPQVTYLHDYDRERFNTTILCFKIKIKDLDNGFIHNIKQDFPTISEEEELYIHIQRPGMIADGFVFPSLALLRPHYILDPVDHAVNNVAEKSFPTNPRLVSVFPNMNYSIEDPDQPIVVHGLNAGTRGDILNQDLSTDCLKIRVNDIPINDYIQNNPDESLTFFSFVEGNGHKALTLHIIPNQRDYIKVNRSLSQIPQGTIFNITDAIKLLPNDGDRGFQFVNEMINRSIQKQIEKDTLEAPHKRELNEEEKREVEKYYDALISIRESLAEGTEENVAYSFLGRNSIDKTLLKNLYKETIHIRKEDGKNSKELKEAVSQILYP
ncbi:MAG: hypothetical protein KBD31_01715 [Proteobacteria bacterium]|nr:hypothetical protein [Pseudomonadota bacterium]